MQIMNYILPDEARVLGLLQPHLNRKLDLRRMPEWITGRKVSAEQPVPIILKETGGVYRSFLRVRGLPSENEMPDFIANIDVHNQKRAIMPLAGFEFDFLSRKPSEPLMAVWPAERDQVFWVAGTYDLKPGSVEPNSFYPMLARTRGGLGHTSSWEPLFIDPDDAQCWLEPWTNRKIEPRGRAFEFFRFGKPGAAA